MSDELQAAIDEVKRFSALSIEGIAEIKKMLGKDADDVPLLAWTAGDFMDGAQDDPDPIDHAIATVLNAVVSGALVPAPAGLAAEPFPAVSRERLAEKIAAPSLDCEVRPSAIRSGVDPVASAFEACQIMDEAVLAGHDNMNDLVLHLLVALAPARAALSKGAVGSIKECRDG